MAVLLRRPFPKYPRYMLMGNTVYRLGISPLGTWYWFPYPEEDWSL